jgi:hypothetical protein
MHSGHIPGAEALLALAIQERDEANERAVEADERAKEAAARVEWLSAVVERYRAGEMPNGHGGDAGRPAGDGFLPEGYGSVSGSVLALMAREGKFLRMPEIAALVLGAGLKDNKQAATYCARNAMKALLRDPAKVVKKGPRYKAIA